MRPGPKDTGRPESDRGRAGTLALVVMTALCVSAIPVGVAGAAGAATATGVQSTTAATGVTSNTTDGTTIAVRQGDTCYEIDPLGDGSETVEEYYDYNISAGYSSLGTTDIQENQVSNLLVYEGAEGYSLVLVHDKYRNAPHGGVASMTFTGLPSDGEWAVEDDGYEGRDDQWNHEGSRTEVDWMWYENRSDGGAFRGLTASEDTSITIEPAFNEEAAAWGEWEASGTEEDRITEWRLHTSPDDYTSLDMDESVTISREACNQAPAAELSAEPEGAAVGESVRLNASNSTDDDGIAEFAWDFDGDGTVDLKTTTPHADYTYDETGEFEATVTVSDYDNATDTATTTVTVTEDGPDDGDENDGSDGNDGDDGDESDGDDGDETDGPDDVPQASLTGPATVTVGESVALDAGDSMDGDGIQSYGWNFDGDTSVDRTTTEATVETSFDEAGAYTVTVTVTDNNGNDATAEHEIEVEQADDGDESDGDIDVGGDGPDGPIIAPIDTGADDDANESDEANGSDDANGSGVSVAAIETTSGSVNEGDAIEVTIHLDEPAEEPDNLPMTISRQDENGTESVVEETEVAVPGNGTRNVSVSRTVDQPGEYRAAVQNQTAAFSVLAAPAGGADGEPLTEQGPATAEEPAQDPGGESTEASTPAETTSGNGPGFGATAAVIGVVLGGIRLARRD
ncbi:PKD domain-containing protein [Halorientalis halophila]|uniref:PKD domain-containing protein n=1 Tax=Halorientalis halophila TaxID=3108499 RepID=UPI00300B7F8B